MWIVDWMIAKFRSDGPHAIWGCVTVILASSSIWPKSIGFRCFVSCIAISDHKGVLWSADSYGDVDGPKVGVKGGHRGPKVGVKGGHRRHHPLFPFSLVPGPWSHLRLLFIVVIMHKTVLMLPRIKVLPSVAEVIATRYLGASGNAVRNGRIHDVSASRIRVWLARQFAASAEENTCVRPISPMANPGLQAAVFSNQANSQVAGEESIVCGEAAAPSRRKRVQTIIRRLSRALRKGRLAYAESLLAEIAQDDEMDLDVKLCNYALDSCASVKDVTRTEALLTIMKKKNIQLDQISYGCLLRSFCRAGALGKAMEVLEGLVRDYQLGSSAVAPNNIMLNTVLNGCANAKNKVLAERCLELMRITNVPRDEVTYTELMKLEGYLQNEKGIERWWKELQQKYPHPAALVHTARVVAICRTKDVASAKRALLEMVRSMTDLHQDPVTKVAVGAEFAIEHSTDAGLADPHDSAVRHDEKGEADVMAGTHPVQDGGFCEKEEMKAAAERWQDDVVSGNASSDDVGQVSSYSPWRGNENETDSQQAFSLVCKQEKPEKVVQEWRWWEGPLPELMDGKTRKVLSQAYNSVINCAYHCGRTDLAERFYAEMRQGGLEPDIYTYNALMRAVGRGRGFQDAKRLMESFEMVGIRPDSYSVSAMIDTLCNEGKIDQAEALLERLHEFRNQSAYAYNRVIDACTAKGDPVRALQIFSTMKTRGIAPNEYTYVSLFSAFGRTNISVGGRSWSRKEVGRRVLALEEDMHNSGVKHTRGTISALVRALGHEGMVDAMLNRMNSVKGLTDAANRPFLNTLTCNIAINACVQVKQVELALNLFEDMESWGCTPDLITYNTLINGCSYNQDMATAFKLMDNMKKKGISPDIISYNALIKVTCHCDKLDLALALLREMSLQGIIADAVTFHTLLASASHHKQLDVIEFVVEHMHREGVKPGIFTCALIATAYLQAERLDEIAESMKVLSARMISECNSLQDGRDSDPEHTLSPNFGSQRIMMSESEVRPETSCEEADKDGRKHVHLHHNLHNNSSGRVEVDNIGIDSSEAELEIKRLLEDAVMKGSEEAAGLYVAKLSALLDGEYPFRGNADDDAKEGSDDNRVGPEQSCWAIRLRKQYDSRVQSMSFLPKTSSN